MSKFYVYGYYCQGVADPFYVGKGFGQRAYKHLTYCKTEPSFFHNKLRSMLEADDRPEIEFFGTGVSESEAIDLERALIRQFGRLDLKTGCLYNQTDGGDGPCGYAHTHETKEKIRQAHLGRKHSLETRMKMAAGHTGKKHGSEWVENMRLAWTGEKREQARQESTGRKYPSRWKAVKCTGLFCRSFSSVQEAVEFTKIGRSAIRNNLNSRSKSAGGCFWEYI